MPVIPDDPFGPIKTPQKGSIKATAKEINELHKSSDVDTHSNAQHHTLGPKINQAAPGNHIHDGKTSKRIGEGMGLTVQTSSGTIDQKFDRLLDMLASIIDFTET